MKKFKSILESNDKIEFIRDVLSPLRDWDFDIKMIKSRYFRIKKDSHNNLGILTGDNDNYLNSYAIVISRKRSGVIRNNQHGIGLYSIQNEMPLIDLSPQEMSNVMSEFFGAVNRIKLEFDCEWSICGPDQFIIIAIVE